MEIISKGLYLRDRKMDLACFKGMDKSIRGIGLIISTMGKVDIYY